MCYYLYQSNVKRRFGKLRGNPTFVFIEQSAKGLGFKKKWKSQLWENSIPLLTLLIASSSNYYSKTSIFLWGENGTHFKKYDGE